ncbi:MAG TPA: ABC transporter permease [Chitinophagaceae bacterium]|nr:ABC transporter permease [Chitinophagaceae bacterium]HMZ46187.1 ABC transporter permease [Chitinophagaceae bacterium]HNJ57965.1 ABC transporter permease [Chitinophagaceae bacterium]HNM33880.1 ABC transporter permease [Chitinophagaceae bacterium]HNN30410.1 ABC transporter permease [Chitinophagaceae bacterium]
MLKLLNILWNSFLMAIQELKVHKLRTLLSLFGIAIGIFCIIGVLATINSLEQYIKNNIESLGRNTIYIQKSPWVNDENTPWWKYQKRPEITSFEQKELKKRAKLISNVAYAMFYNSSISYGNTEISRVLWSGVTEEFDKILVLEVLHGRYLSNAEFERGTNSVVLGYTIAKDLFGNPEYAIGKTISLGNKKAIVIGTLKEQGSSMDGWQFDDRIIVPHLYCKQVANEENSGGFIIAKANDNYALDDVKGELTGILRAIRKIQPTEEDNFALNDISATADPLKSFFSQVTIGGWAIAGLSLIVGAFGVANIMFVTVRERTSQIGLKKAIGAKSKIILTEFLIESAFLCMIGGLIGLAFVWLLTKALGGVLPFPIFIAPNIILLAFNICVVLGVLSGIIPATIAAKMNPVVAIRTK